MIRFGSNDDQIDLKDQNESYNADEELNKINIISSNSALTNSILNKHTRNFHSFKSSSSSSPQLIKSSNFNINNANLVEKQQSSINDNSTNESKTNLTAKYKKWKFMSRKRNSSQNLIHPSERDLNKKLINNQQEIKLNNNKKNFLENKKSDNLIIPTVQINTTNSGDKLLNPLTLYQMYHKNDLKFKNGENNEFISNLDQLKIQQLTDHHEERRSLSSSFGKQYVCSNLFEDNIRPIDFVIVYDSLIHEYGKKFLNKSISSSISLNNKESISKQIESDKRSIKSQNIIQNNEINDKFKNKKIDEQENELNNEIRRLSSSNLSDLDKMDEQLDQGQDEEIEYLETKIIDIMSQKSPQINNIERKKYNIFKKLSSNEDSIFDNDSNNDNNSDNSNQLLNQNLNNKSNRNDMQLNQRQRYLAECCKRFEENLLNEGLELEFSEAQFVNTNNKRIGFLKIHCPWMILCKYAELMKFKMPMKQIETSWRVVFDEKNDPYSKHRFTAPYSKDKEYLFDIPADNRLFFSSSQRSQIVEFILKRKSFSTNLNDTSFGISKLIHEGAYIAHYPLHEGILDYHKPKKSNLDYEEEQIQNQMYNSGSSLNNFFIENSHSPRVLLNENWASLKNIFRNQPLDEIRKYYGVRVGLYFAFLGFYTSMLVPAAILGLLCFLYGVFTIDSDIPIQQVCNKSFDKFPMCPLCNVKGCDYFYMSESCDYLKYSYLFDNPATILFTVFMSLWSTVYLEMWKRYISRITYRWDLSTFDTFEEYPRPEYLARLSKSEKKRFNMITNLWEPYISFFKRQLPYTIFSSTVVLLLILVALASVIGVIIYRVSVRAALAQYDHMEKYSQIFTSVTAALINLFCILIFNQIYGYVSFYLTELEMPRTQTDFDNSLTLKMYLLQFVNYYSSIFYIAFFKGRLSSHPGEIIDNSKFTSLTQEECSTGGCLLELSIQLAIIMVGKQFFGGVVEMLVPWLNKKIKYWRLKKKDKSTTFLNLRQAESDFLLGQWTPRSLFYEYLEMILQFGFLSIFSAGFSLGPLFALINNLLEIRLDASKMITSLRRPVGQRVRNIGIWYRILDIISKLSVISTGLIIAFTSEFIPRLYYYSKHGNLNHYLNQSLSYFNASEINTVGNREKFFKHFNNQPHLCMYQGYRHPPNHQNKYEPTQTNWEILAIKLGFVVIFENLIITATMLIRYLIPDVPRSLRQKMRQHAYLTNELIMQNEIKRAKAN